MGEWFIGEIRLFPYNRVPAGWLPCNGTVLQINNFNVLYSLMGIKYGGDGRTTFKLPDLRGRVPLGTGTATYYHNGMADGAETVTLTSGQLPIHNHLVSASSANGDENPPISGFPAVVPPSTTTGAPPPPQIYTTDLTTGLTPLAMDAIGAAGANQPHENRQPTLAMVYCIAWQGLYPPRQ